MRRIVMTVWSVAAGVGMQSAHNARIQSLRAKTGCARARTVPKTVRAVIFLFMLTLFVLAVLAHHCATTAFRLASGTYTLAACVARQYAV